MRAIARYSVWVAVATLWATLCFALPDFLDNPADNWRSVLTLAAYVIAVGIGNLFLISFLISGSKWHLDMLVYLTLGLRDWMISR